MPSRFGERDRSAGFRGRSACFFRLEAPRVRNVWSRSPASTKHDADVAGHRQEHPPARFSPLGFGVVGEVNTTKFWVTPRTRPAPRGAKWAFQLLRRNHLGVLQPHRGRSRRRYHAGGSHRCREQGRRTANGWMM